MVLGDNMAASIPVGDIVRLSQLGWQIYEMEMAWGDSGGAEQERFSTPIRRFQERVRSVRRLATAPEDQTGD
jgi:hypothetical protein